jgi:hypothetical protein
MTAGPSGHGIGMLRADDLIVIGVHWSGFTVGGTAAAPALIAGPSASLTIVLPPQHVGEQTSALGSAPPASGWRGVVSAPSQLQFDVDEHAVIPLTVAGILAAIDDNSLVPQQSSIELPWRLVIAPRGRVSGTVSCRTTESGTGNPTALWRMRALDPASPRDTRADADLECVVVDRTTANTADPFPLPLDAASRDRLFLETSGDAHPQPARVRRLQFSTLGGTLDADGTWPNFEWTHRTVLGRDMTVRTLTRGVLYPLGHRAVFATFSHRVFDPSAGDTAVLRTIRLLTVVEPIRQPPADGPARRGFPFGDVEITRTVFVGLDDPVWFTSQLPPHGTVRTHFWPTVNSTRTLFPTKCATRTGEVTFSVPLLFVADLAPNIPTLTNPTVARDVHDTYQPAATQVAITPTILDLAGTASGNPGDTQEVHAVTVTGVDLRDLDLSDGYRPKLAQLVIGLPALRMLLGTDASPMVSYADDYVRDGTGDVLLKLAATQTIDFSANANRSGGLLTPTFTATAISRRWGPVNALALPDAEGKIDVRALFPSTAGLLGVPLRELVTNLTKPPQIVPVPGSDPPRVQLAWPDIDLGHDFGPFTPNGGTAKLQLAVVTGPVPQEPVPAAATTDGTSCSITNFALQFPSAAAKIVSVSFDAMEFVQAPGKSPQVTVSGVSAAFFGDLQLIEDLAHNLALTGAREFVDVTPTGVAVRYALAIPTPPPVGGFLIRNLSLSFGIVVPFGGEPVSMVLAFASRANPFQVSVLMFGGGGYLEMTLDRNGVTRFEAALEFGALMAVNFGIARGEMHVLGGVRFVKQRDGLVTITGYLRIGGCVQVLGLVTVSIELSLSLSYNPDTNALIGRAVLVLEIDLTLWSDKIEIDSGNWVLPGSGRAGFGELTACDVVGDRDELYARWQQYRAAFAPTSGSATSLAGQAAR